MERLRTFLAVTQQSDCQPVNLLVDLQYDVNQAHQNGWVKMKGSEVKVGDSVLINGVGQSVLIGEVN